MRRMLWVSAAALLVFPAAALSQQAQPQSGSQQNQDQQAQQSTSAQNQSSQTQDQSQSATPQQDSLAAAARKAREQKKETPKPAAKVFTNENIPTEGGISAVGEEKESGSAQAGGAQAASSSGNDEKSWRDKFAKLHHKLDQDQAALDVMQREVGVAQVQYYGGDPNKAVTDGMGQQPFGSDYTKKLGDIEAKKKQVEADKQTITDAEEELRKSGGSPGWAR